MRRIPSVTVVLALVLSGVGAFVAMRYHAGATRDLGAAQIPSVRVGKAGPRRAVARANPRIQPLTPMAGPPHGDWRSFAPETLTVQLAPNLVLPFRVTHVERDAGRTVLTARLERTAGDGGGLDGAFLVSTANSPDRWEAVVVVPGEEYRVHAVGDQVSTEAVAADGWGCGAERRARGGSSRTQELQTPLSGAGTIGSLAAAGAAAGGPDQVDVLFLCNADAVAAKQGDLAGIDADASNYIAAANAILENSQIANFRWHYLAAVAAPAYPATTLLQDDLDQMTNGSISAFVVRQQSTYGADQVVMLVGGWRSDAAGVAWIGGDPNRVAVVYPCLTADRTPASTATSSLVVCHELGHNFGCRHDRTTENVPDGDAHYCYGFRFTDGSGAYPVADQGTVMSYAGSRIPFFSSPEVSYHGYALGIPIGQPRAAFNAETMSENAARIAATSPVRLRPAITGQPQSVSVPAGERLALAVTATGGSLTYQWYQNGIVVGGAVGPTYTVSYAAPTDAGTFTVTVSNELGAVTSQPATVTISAAATGIAATGAAAPAGGSSGGGTFERWSVAALLLLVAARGRRRCGTGESAPV